MANTHRSRETRDVPNSALASPGPYLAKVINHLDPTYMGVLEVELLHDSGNDSLEETQLHYVKYLSPFAGQTSLLYNKNTDDYDNTQKSYGFWMIPPDPGVIVMCLFVDGDPRKGYWFGCAPDLNMNFMVPGHAATELATTKGTDKTRVPVAEYNKIVHEDTAETDLTQLTKPASRQEKMLDEQGLLEDDTRGITSSSARREVPSAVFGISTPGPIDKQGPKGPIGKNQTLVKDAFISRLTGSSFVMDDGDNRWERKTPPWEGPPEYADVLAEETGLRDRPHNELIRFRTRTGHQILMHTSEDLIYIGNSRGTAWIELTSDGKLDIFATDSISIHTKQDFNFYADRDFNLELGGNFNIKVAGEINTLASTEKKIIKSTQDINIQGDARHIYDSSVKREIKGFTDFKFIGNLRERVDSNHTTKVAGNRMHYTMGNQSHLINGTRALTVKGDNLIVTQGSELHTTNGSFDVNTQGSNNFTTSSSTNIRSGGSHVESASTIHMNGPGAASASTSPPLSAFDVPILVDTIAPLVLHELPGHTGDVEFSTILKRVTTREPYPHHENLDPSMFKPAKTQRDTDGRMEPPTPPVDNEPR